MDIGGFDPRLSFSLPALLASWGEAWGVADLSNRIEVRFSQRLRRTLGRCQPERGLVTIHFGLAGSDLLPEVLCHEAAHYAVWLLYGRGPRPHGPEWRELVERAGHPARRAIPAHEANLQVSRSKPRRRMYLHECPVCGVSRRAARPVPTWRCRPCVESGRPGVMIMRRLEEP
ncbi:MAG: SprT-like domain-containing protein [Candidatus Xenobium sp.]